MTGLSWLGGKSWWELSRDERYFCAELFHHIRQDIGYFVGYLNRDHGADLQPNSNWEVVYEACFYRDLWHAGPRDEPLFSPKRTFDLALFSDDDILLIEAKAQQAFDPVQLQLFARDAEQVQKQTKVKRVRLAALASSLYQPDASVREQFSGPYITWKDLAALYGGDPKLHRADALFEQPAAWKAANNKSGHMQGASLLAAFEDGARFFVGRDGGLDGARFADDVATGRWQRQSYQTDREAQKPSNRNWFSLEDFAGRVRRERQAPQL
jgi:hypothetical protein